jgi:acyl-coenzyme A thioesterase PaaI-like protein
MTTSLPPPRSAADQTLVDATITEIFQEMITFNRVLGLQILSVKPGDVRAQFAMRPNSWATTPTAACMAA